jgi:ABC-2 type transport system ATP-binding protein
MLHENLIKADDISYAYATALTKSSQKNCIDHISFQLQRGEILAFLGPNGAGKSTTMQLLTGNLAASSGNISIAGYDLSKQSLQAKACIGYLADTPPLYKDMQVDEYLIYCGQLRQLTHQQLIKALDYVKQRCGLASFGKRLISQLSKGMQQRIGIAQAIIHQPDIIILDEPSNGLDPVQKHEILSLIKELGESHSVIISTHSWSDVKQAGCNKVQIINQGKLVYKNSFNQLNQQLQGHNLTVSCLYPVDINKLLLIKGVESVNEMTPDSVESQSDEEQLGADQSFKGQSLTVSCHESLTTNNIHHISAAIVDLSCQQNWGLSEIKIEKKSFDAVFLSLTNKHTDNIV